MTVSALTPTYATGDDGDRALELLRAGLATAVADPRLAAALDALRREAAPLERLGTATLAGELFCSPFDGIIYFHGFGPGDQRARWLRVGPRALERGASRAA